MKQRTRRIRTIWATALLVLIAAPLHAYSRSEAVLGYQRALVATLTRRNDANALMGAALIARTLPQHAHGQDFHTLIERAGHAAPTQPAIAWLQLSDCDAAALDCPNDNALATLRKLAPDNAAVWLLALGNAVRNDDHHDARQALTRASQASGYDDYAGRSLKALADAVDAAPVPGSITGAGLSPYGVRALIVYALGQTQPRPGLQIAAALCRSKVVTVRQDCLRLGRLLLHASSPRARSLGLHLLETLAGDAHERTSARDARRTLVWQVQAFSRLTRRADSDDVVARKLLSLARRGEPEMSLMQDALRALGVPVTPPAGWHPGDGDSHR